VVDVTGAEAQELTEQMFYGTIRTIDSRSKGCRRNYIARGGILEMHKCYVGGASNGVETGEVHRSNAPLLNYRFEYVLRRKQGTSADNEKIS
jgi:hypothetical protein